MYAFTMSIFSNLRLSGPISFLFFLLTIARSDAAFAQNVILPTGTTARAQLIRSSSVHNGQSLSAKLMDPIYQRDKLVLPAGTLLQGNIVDLAADRKRRIRARFNGDFTPFHQSHVQFHSMTLPSGETVPFETTEERGSVVVQLASPSLALGIGYYAVATSSYDSFIAKGPDVAFSRNTRLEIQLQSVKAKESQGTVPRKSLSVKSPKD